MTLGSYSVLTVTSTEKAHSTSNVNNIEYFCERLSLHNLSDLWFWKLNTFLAVRKVLEHVLLHWRVQNQNNAPKSVNCNFKQLNVLYSIKYVNNFKCVLIIQIIVWKIFVFCIFVLFLLIFTNILKSSFTWITLLNKICMLIVSALFLWISLMLTVSSILKCSFYVVLSQ